MVLKPLDPKKTASEENRREQEKQKRLVPGLLGGMDRQSHGQTAGQEDGSIDCAIEDNGMPAGLSKRLGIRVAIDYITHEHSPKKENLRGQEGPHAEGRSLFLLRHVVELFSHRCVRISHGSIPPQLRPSIDKVAGS